MSAYVVEILERSFSLVDQIALVDPLHDDEIDPSDVDGEFRRQPRLIKLYGAILGEAETTVDRAEARLEKLEAVLYGEERAKLVSAGQKSTEAAVEAAVTLRAEREVALHDVQEAKRVKRLCKAMVDAMQHKLQALISEGSNRRKASVEDFVVRRQTNGD